MSPVAHDANLYRASCKQARVMKGNGLGFYRGLEVVPRQTGGALNGLRGLTKLVTKVSKAVVASGIPQALVGNAAKRVPELLAKGSNKKDIIERIVRNTARDVLGPKKKNGRRRGRQQRGGNITRAKSRSSPRGQNDRGKKRASPPAASSSPPAKRRRCTMKATVFD